MKTSSYRIIQTRDLATGERVWQVYRKTNLREPHSTGYASRSLAALAVKRFDKQDRENPNPHRKRWSKK